MPSNQNHDNIIRIGTRSSSLALWQANTVSGKLTSLGHKTEIVPIESHGDINLSKPLYELGITGVFTRNLDIALLDGRIDIAVHSFKDVPTRLPNGIVEAAVLERGDIHDVLVLKSDDQFLSGEEATIATGSLRRKAQWLHKYPNHKITGLRGNVNTRLRKLEENDWNGAIFAKAGLERIQLLPEAHIVLDWMVPAPAQGAVVITARENETGILDICSEINDEDTSVCVRVEREFLRVLEGGCTAPIGANARIENGLIYFKGVLHSPDGRQMIDYESHGPVSDAVDLGRKAAEYIIGKGGKDLMKTEEAVSKNIMVYSTRLLTTKQEQEFQSKFSVNSSDFIKIQLIPQDEIRLDQIHDHLIFTSQNAVKAVLDHDSVDSLRNRSIFCVGKNTGKLIEKNLGAVSYTATSAEALALYLVNNHQQNSFTFFCGNLRQAILPDTLRENSIEIEEIECYKTIPDPVKINDLYEAVLFYSPSGVQSFIMENSPGDSVAFCIGNTTGAMAQKFFKKVVISEKSTIEGVIESVNDYYN